MSDEAIQSMHPANITLVDDDFEFISIPRCATTPSLKTAITLPAKLEKVKLHKAALPIRSPVAHPAALAMLQAFCRFTLLASLPAALSVTVMPALLQALLLSPHGRRHPGYRKLTSRSARFDAKDAQFKDITRRVWAMLDCYHRLFAWMDGLLDVVLVTLPTAQALPSRTAQISGTAFASPETGSDGISASPELCYSAGQDLTSVVLVLGTAFGLCSVYFVTRAMLWSKQGGIGDEEVRVFLIE